MPVLRRDVKLRLHACGKTIADLSRKTGEPYPRLIGALNGYWFLTDPQERAVEAALKAWEAERSADADTVAREQTP